MNDNLDCQKYWDETSEEYQEITRISIDDFHYGPLLPGDKEVKALPGITKGMKCLEIGSGAGQNSLCPKNYFTELLRQADNGRIHIECEGSYMLMHSN